MLHYGLLGTPLTHSFSPNYFKNKFLKENTPAEYLLFDTPHPNPQLLFQQNPLLHGLNVTIPHKQAVIPFLHEIDPTAAAIGAVNTIKKMPDGQLKGYNTDAPGFEQAFRKIAQPHQKTALILGNGGASLAILHVLQNLGISTSVWTRKEIQTPPVSLENFSIIVQCTPVGTFPNEHECLPLRFSEINPGTSVIDLIYNPAETVFLQQCRLRGAVTQNGLPMLENQAELSWSIWNGI
jgi:shikimate dehydrogenase